MMDTSDILKKVRKIEIRSRGLSSQLFLGHYHSAFKGRGMAFNEVREYQFGDAIRDIDWNVTARFNHPFVKVYNEERELTVMLLVDVSGSNLTGTGDRIKQDRITEIAALLSYSALKNNDKVGVIFFTDRVEKFIPPGKGSQHILSIIRQLVDFKPSGRKTNIAEVLRYLSNIIRKRCIAFIMSDFLDDHFGDALRITARKHDLVGIRVYDPIETSLPVHALLRVMDPETGRTSWLDAGSENIREAYRKDKELKIKDLSALFLKSGVDFEMISTNEDYVKPLIRLFQRRESRK
jgi:uncharacterized protein (DUF58 family)